MASGRIGRSLALLDSVPQLLRNAAASRLRAEDERIARLSQTVSDASSQRLKEAGERLASTEALCRRAGSEATLKRGYSITRLGGEAVRDASRLCPGQEITTVFASGEVVSENKMTHSPLSTQYSVLSTLYSLLSTLYSLLSTLYSLLSTLYSHSLLSTLYSLLSTQYFLLSKRYGQRNDIYRRASGT